MHIYEHFRYSGGRDRWVVPEGVTSAVFECWGAAGGMPSALVFEGKKRQVVGGSGPKNTYFYNGPNAQSQLGRSYSNNAGYARGTRTVSAGEEFWVYVGGNGSPGFSTIKVTDSDNVTVGQRGGAGGWNGGGDGGEGAKITQNLYDGTNTKVHYQRSTIPPSAKSGQRWMDTSGSANTLYECNTTYTKGHDAISKWDQVTHEHPRGSGPAGGGGGGATDIRFNGTDTGDRILIAAGSGGAGGHYVTTGKAAWTLRVVPSTPKPPFGKDDNASGATGPDNTWSTSINYLIGGWGRGGIGGGGPVPAGKTTADGGIATEGVSGGPATGRHKDGNAPGSVGGSGGNGGTNDAGGAKGSGGNSTSGSLGQGGTGATAPGDDDDWCAGGGGGGGGYYGGGGGGQGFKVSGQSTSTGIHTYAGGGGGGSNYADPSFTHIFLGGCARPPVARGNNSTGANGKGGFARISYTLPPKAKWKIAPSSSLASSPFTVEFTYVPAKSGGAKIAYYVVGTATDPDATFPTSQSTIMVSNSSQTVFSHVFTAPAATDSAAYFVQVVDTDGDISDWIKHKIVGKAAADTTPATITSPSSGDTFEGSATVDWTVGTQTPLVAYRLGITGDAVPPNTDTGAVTDWRRGGSRVNLATDPGFVTRNDGWSSTDNADLVADDSTYGGVSGKDGVIAWEQTDDGTAENHTATFEGLKADTAYRLHLEVASGRANDFRPVQVEVYDDGGLVASTVVPLTAAGAGSYVAADLPFTPHNDGVYVQVTPSASGTTGDAIETYDFEGDDGDGDVDGWTASSGAVTADTDQSQQGDYALKVTGAGTSVASSPDMAPDMFAATTDLGFVVQGWVYAPSGAARDAAIRVSGGGLLEVPPALTTTVRDAWVFLRGYFVADPETTVQIDVDGDTGGIWYDYIEVYAGDFVEAELFGNTDTGETHYLANMLIELGAEEDGDGDLPTYFDGSHTNGNSGTAAWVGTTNESPSSLTGTDVTTGDIAYAGAPLLDAHIFLDTLSIGELVDAYDGAEATVDVYANPSAPETPTVTLASDSGMVLLTINAADGSADTKTVSFDIFRNDVRIVTGLVPDDTTREATYYDSPATGAAATYKVRAWDDAHGYADQTDGTVE